jgi:hypothetical protein
MPLKAKDGAQNRLVLTLPNQGSRVLYNALVPPSPNDLARRLHDIQTRSESPLFGEESDSSSESASNSGAAVDVADICSESTLTPLQDATVPEIANIPIHPPLSIEISSLSVPSKAAVLSRKSTEEDDAAEDALKDAIRSVYKLWRLARRIDSPTYDEGEQFLETVRQVVAETSYQ